MNDEPDLIITYIQTPRVIQYPERIDAILERRLREFLLSRRQKIWHEEGW